MDVKCTEGQASLYWMQKGISHSPPVIRYILHSCLPAVVDHTTHYMARVQIPDRPYHGHTHIRRLSVTCSHMHSMALQESFNRWTVSCFTSQTSYPGTSPCCLHLISVPKPVPANKPGMPPCCLLNVSSRLPRFVGSAGSEKMHTLLKLIPTWIGNAGSAASAYSRTTGCPCSCSA